jgi:hypothetical protein
MELIGINSVDFDIINYRSHILHSSDIGAGMGVQWDSKQLFTTFKKPNDSVRRGVLYNILIEFDIPIKLVKLQLTLQNPVVTICTTCFNNQ